MHSEAKSRIGLFGGTFDPIHRGHISMAAFAKDEGKLDEVWFLPAPVPPHKRENSISAFSHRLFMIQLAIRDREGLVCSDLESHMDAPSYTAHTLEKLSSLYPDCQWYFIIGADSLFQIKTWYLPEKIFSLASLMVALRGYADLEGNRKDLGDIEREARFLREKYGARIYLLGAPIIDISSTQVRKLAAEGRDLIPYVPEPVAEYIVKNKLYVEEKKEGENSLEI